MARRWKRGMAIAAVVLAGGVLTFALVGVLSWRRPAGVGTGELAPCPSSPNCVCSRAMDTAHRAEPLAFEGDADEAWRRLKALVAARPRTRLVKEGPDYLHFEVTSLVFRFVDDVEFVLDRAEKRVHFRSASRVGHSDLGVNRARLEEIRRAFGSTGR